MNNVTPNKRWCVKFNTILFIVHSTKFGVGFDQPYIKFSILVLDWRCLNIIKKVFGYGIPTRYVVRGYHNWGTHEVHYVGCIHDICCTRYIVWGVVMKECTRGTHGWLCARSSLTRYLLARYYSSRVFTSWESKSVHLNRSKRWLFHRCANMDLYNPLRGFILSLKSI